MERTHNSKIYYEFRERNWNFDNENNSKLDAGPYMLQEKIPIEKEDDYESLSNKLSNLGSKLIIKSLDFIEKEILNSLNKII